MKTRTYKSGTGWCFWRWTEVPTGYITRLHIIKTPWLAVCLHFLNSPDPEPWLHDHPVSFLSVILWGGYTEVRSTGPAKVYNNRLQAFRALAEFYVKHRWFNFVRASKHDRHSIIEVEPHTVTLCFMGPKVREWGFHTPDGWVHWQTYNDRRYKGAAWRLLRGL